MADDQTLFNYKDRKILIADFEKELKILNKVSIDEVLDAVSEISNRNLLPFKTITRILRSAVYFMYKSKRFTENDLENYMFSFNDISYNQNISECVLKIDAIIKNYSLSKSIEFLKNRIAYLQNINTERTKLFDISVALSDSYVKNKDFENAFKELRRATIFVNRPTEQFEYLWKLRIIYEKSAEICFKEKKPHYEEYLIFSLESWALEIARDLVAFPHLSGFYYRKKIQASPYCDDGYDSLEISPDEDSDMDISLKHLKIFKNRKEMFHEYLNFIYNDLPVIYGIPSKYNEESINRIFDAQELNSEEWNDLIFIFPEKLNKQSITKLTFEINRFVTNLLKKYYDMGNH